MPSSTEPPNADYRSVPTTRIVLTAPDGASVTYVVRLDKRTGMRTRESYDAEVARIVKMGEDAGRTVQIDSSEANTRRTI